MKNIKYFFVGIWDEFCKDLKYSVDCYVEQGRKKKDIDDRQEIINKMTNMLIDHEILSQNKPMCIDNKDPDAEYMQKLDADHNKITLQNNHD